MPISMPRGMFVKVADYDSARVLYRYGCGSLGRLESCHATIKVVSLPVGVDNTFNYIGPFGFLEYNLIAMWVPYTVAASFTPPTHLDGTPRLPVTDEEWDVLFRRLAFEFGNDGNEFYGANPDGSASTYDAVRNIFTRKYAPTGSEEQASGDQADGSASSIKLVGEPLQGLNPGLAYGPRGIIRLASIERFLSADSVTNAAQNIPILGSVLGDTGLNDIVYADEMEGTIHIGGSTGFFLLGVVRYNTAVAPGSAFTFKTGDSARLRALNAWMTGDSARIQNMIHWGNDDASDFLRSVMFGGDVDIDNPATALPKMAEFFTDGQFIRRNPLCLAGKLEFTLGLPFGPIPIG